MKNGRILCSEMRGSICSGTEGSTTIGKRGGNIIGFPTNSTESNNVYSKGDLNISRTPKYSIEQELQFRYDGGRSYFILIDKIDLSSLRFIEEIKLVVNDIVSLKGKKINIEVFDSKESLYLMYRSDYGTNSLGRILTNKERKVLERHYIAGFAGELKTMAYSNTLIIFPSAFKSSPEVGKYCQSLEFNPN